MIYLNSPYVYKQYVYAVLGGCERVRSLLIQDQRTHSSHMLKGKLPPSVAVHFLLPVWALDLVITLGPEAGTKTQSRSSLWRGPRQAQLRSAPLWMSVNVTDGIAGTAASVDTSRECAKTNMKNVKKRKRIFIQCWHCSGWGGRLNSNMSERQKNNFRK